MILPLIVDPGYEVDMDTLEDWERGEWLVSRSKLEMIWPVKKY
jgi:hypothetical protein